MLRITIELIPGGDERFAKVMGVGYITNTGQGDEYRGEYITRLKKSEQLSKRKGKGYWKQGRVFDFPRKSLGPWDLLYRALHVMIGDRNKKILE